MNSFPCKCGHKASRHSDVRCYDVEDLIVTEKFVDPSCFCLEYRPDNLKYLEQIALDKITII